MGSLAAEAQSHGAHVIHCPFGPAHIGFYRQLSRILIEGNYDLLHSHAGVYSGYAAWIAAQCDIPVISSFHNTTFAPQTRLTQRHFVRKLRSLYAKISIQYALQHSLLTTGCSKDVLSALEAFESQSHGRRTLLHYGVNIPEPGTPQQRKLFRESFGWNNNTLILTHVGRFFEQKNHIGLISIFEIVQRNIPDARLLLVGDGPLRPTIEQRVRELNLTENVLFLGLRDDVAQIMSNSDLFLMPSLFEGLPVASLEAQAAGLPIIGTRVRGLVDAVVDGETAILHDLGNYEDMACDVIRLSRSPEEARRMGAAGRERVQQYFSTHASATRLMELYNESGGVA